jgi:hypothetical protein
MKIRAMVYLDGLIAGMIGAAIIALWFLLDALIRLPFYTPTVLGEGLFLRTQDLALTEGEQVSLKLTLMYTAVHGLVFMASVQSLGNVKMKFVRTFSIEEMRKML